jgi:hypothetical protein
VKTSVNPSRKRTSVIMGTGYSVLLRRGSAGGGPILIRDRDEKPSVKGDGA